MRAAFGSLRTMEDGRDNYADILEVSASCYARSLPPRRLQVGSRVACFIFFRHRLVPEREGQKGRQKDLGLRKPRVEAVRLETCLIVHTVYRERERGLQAGPFFVFLD